MEWTEAIREAILYIEKHITEYIRNRRLSLAGQELLTSDITVMELAIKYGYDLPDSFAKAFHCFHGNSPSIVRRNKTIFLCFGRSVLSI